MKKVIIWTSGIDKLIEGDGVVGGLTVQMYFWAKAFLSNGYKVYSFSKSGCNKIEGIHFIRWNNFRWIGLITDMLFAFIYIIKLRPDYIINRGAGRNLFILSLLSKVFFIKLIHMGASDTDYEPSKELIAGHTIQRKLYQIGLKYVDYFIAQNKKQSTLLKDIYNKNNIIIPNIWLENNLKTPEEKREFILWVSNFRELKRPKWFIELARKNKDCHFVMIGAAFDNQLYSNCEEMADATENLSFLGAMSLQEVNKKFAQAKFFVCTSYIEGFPNTFLQSWSNGIPVITTFDPSGIVKEQGLGIVVNNEVELNYAVRKLLSDEMLYKELSYNVNKYFIDKHSIKVQFEKLINYII